MECRFVHVCVLLAAVIIGGSYAYGYGRHHGYHPEPQRFHGGPYHGYGGGYHGRPRHDYSHDHESSSEEEEEEEDHDDQKFWRFQIADDFDAYAYIDQNGHTAGFLIDLLRAICEKAGKQCYYMVDTSSHCWRTDGEKELPGIGLMDHYYDGCLGYWQSTNRRNSFNFSLPFTNDVKASLHYKAGEKIENPTAVTGKKIGFVAGWPVSKRCFENHPDLFTGNEPGKYEPVIFETHQLMNAALQRGDVNAILTVDSYKDEPLNIQHTEPSFHCTEAGASVMTMYGSELLNWWNDAFIEMRLNGDLRRLCQRASRVHASQGELDCAL